MSNNTESGGGSTGVPEARSPKGTAPYRDTALLAGGREQTKVHRGRHTGEPGAGYTPAAATRARLKRGAYTLKCWLPSHVLLPVEVHEVAEKPGKGVNGLRNLRPPPNEHPQEQRHQGVPGNDLCHWAHDTVARQGLHRCHVLFAPNLEKGRMTGKQFRGGGGGGMERARHHRLR
jgi:hypothetical protein